MRILVIVPWKANENLLRYERQFVASDTDVIDLEQGVLVRSNSDIAYNLPPLLDSIKAAEKKGYGAVVLACFGDPGLEVARELVTIPVLGPTNVGLHVAAMIGHKTCILLPEYKHLRNITWQNVITYGFHERVVVRGNDVSVPQALQAYEDYTATGRILPFIEDMTNICARSAEEDDVDVVMLGCGGIKWMKGVLELRLRERGYFMPVVEPLSASIQVARGFINMKVSHGRRGYPSPPSD